MLIQWGKMMINQQMLWYLPKPDLRQVLRPCDALSQPGNNGEYIKLMSIARYLRPQVIPNCLIYFDVNG